MNPARSSFPFWRNKFSILMAMLLLGGCTSVRSVPLTDAKFLGIAPEGIIYRLPATALVVKATYELKECPIDRGKGTLPINVAITNAVITSKSVADSAPEAAFVVDPRDMTSWFKEVKEAKLELRNGLLMAVTYDAKDKTREILSSAAGLFLKFAVPEVGAISALAQPEILEELPKYCNDATIKALKKRDTLIKALNELKKNLRGLSGKLAEITTKPISDSYTGERRLNDTKAIEKEIEFAKKNMADVSGALGRLKANNLTFTMEELIIPRHGTEEYDSNPLVISSKLISPADDDLRKWLNPALWESANLSHLSKAKGVVTILKFVIILQEPSTGQAVSAEAFDGIYYRSPIAAEVVVYARVQADSSQSRAIARSRGAFPQFGTLARIRITNGIFQDNRYVVKFDQQGVLTSFEYQERNARLFEALKTGEDIIKKVEDAEKDRIDRETSILNAETERLKAQKNLMDAKNSLEETK